VVRNWKKVSEICRPITNDDHVTSLFASGAVIKTV
jgi:hypothetical protein